MAPDDRELLGRVQRMHSTLGHRAVLLAHVRSDVDVYAEGLRDLSDLGELFLARVAELDTVPVDPTKRQPVRIVALSAVLSELALERCREGPDGGQ